MAGHLETPVDWKRILKFHKQHVKSNRASRRRNDRWKIPPKKTVIEFVIIEGAPFQRTWIVSSDGLKFDAVWDQ